MKTLKVWRVACPGLSDEEETIKAPSAREAAVWWAELRGHDVTADCPAVVVTGEDGVKHAFELAAEIVWRACRVPLESV